MIGPRSPGPRAAEYARACGQWVPVAAGGTLAVERADSPGYVRVYRRPPGGGTWSRASLTLADTAARLYGHPAPHDSSD